MYRLIFILLSIIVFSACRSDKQKDDFSFSGIKIARYDRLQYEATVQNSFFSLQRMNTEFSQETRLLIEEVLDLGSVDMVDMNDRLCAYFSDSILVHLMEDVGEKFKDVSNLEQHLTQGFSNLKKEIHELPVPQIYTQISALNQSVVVGDSILGIIWTSIWGVTILSIKNIITQTSDARCRRNTSCLIALPFICWDSILSCGRKVIVL
ncbi:hypothetical protein [Phocaeicola plebeius]|uniref:gliding motility protein GldB-related protein n=1 Tax=Phocaeicola plebeius TaxID=310297 RepID=UPI00350E471C